MAILWAEEPLHLFKARSEDRIRWEKTLLQWSHSEVVLLIRQRRKKKKKKNVQYPNTISIASKVFITYFYLHTLNAHGAEIIMNNHPLLWVQGLIS